MSDENIASPPEPSQGGEPPRPAARSVAIVARIHGRVQGVGYRYWARTQAEALDLKGYVRNLTDGTVEALLVGDPTDVARMLTYCEEGPPAARVARIETARPAPDAPLDLKRFRRAPTRDPGEPV